MKVVSRFTRAAAAVTLGAFLSVTGAGIATPAGSFAAEQGDPVVPSVGTPPASLESDGSSLDEGDPTSKPQPSDTGSKPSQPNTQSGVGDSSVPSQSRTTGNSEEQPAVAQNFSGSPKARSNGSPSADQATITLTVFEEEQNEEDEDVPLEGATFQLWKMAGGADFDTADAAPVDGEQTTDTAGKIVWTSENPDPTARYFAQETQAPQDFALPDPAVWEVALDSETSGGFPIPSLDAMSDFLLIGTSSDESPVINVHSSKELGATIQVPWGNVASEAKSPWPVPGAADFPATTDYTGNIAFTRKTGKAFSSNNIDIYANLGIVSKSANPADDPTSARWKESAGASWVSVNTGASAAYKQNIAQMDAVQTQLEALKTYVQNADEPGFCTASWSGSSPRTFNVDDCDKNGDGVAIIRLTTSELQNGQYLIQGTGDVFPIFKIDSGTFKLNNASMSVSQDLADAFGGMGAMFVQLGPSSDPFQFSNALVNGVGVYDLRMSGDGTFEMSNVQGCGQFVGQLLNFNNVSLRGCTFAPPAATTTYTGALEVRNQPSDQPRGGVCVPGELFAVTRDGHVVQGNESDGGALGQQYENPAWADLYSAWNLKAEGLNQGPNTPRKDGVDGVAVAADGTFYAFARYWQYDPYYPSTKWNRSIKMMVKEPGGDWTWLDESTSQPKTYRWAHTGSRDAIAGAVNPDNGHYVYGGMRDSGSNVFFMLREINVDPDSPDFGKESFLGRVQVPAASKGGEIAFDSDGNLYVVTQGSNKLTVMTISKTDLEQGRIDNAGIASYSDWPTILPSTAATGSGATSYAGGTVTGAAIGTNGGLYVSTDTQVVQVDPVTAEALTQPVFTNPYTGANSAMTGLASCKANSATTLTIQKVLDAEEDVEVPKGGFTLSASPEGSSIPFTSGTAKTKVEGSNVLAETAGPALVMPGTALVLREDSLRIGAYEADLTCRIDGVEGEDGEIEVLGDAATTGNITIPQEAAGKNVTCTFTNTPKVVKNNVCVPGELFAGTTNGYVVVGPEEEHGTGDEGTKYKDPAWRNLYTAWSGNKLGVNGIAMTADGTLYAFARKYTYYTDRPGDSYRMRMLTKGPEDTEPWKWLSTAEYEFSHTDQPVAGGFDPTTSRYVWGGFRTISSKRYFVIREINPSDGTVYPVGKVEVPAGIGNGDLVFDNAGNLYIVGHKGSTPQSLTVATVTKSELDAARVANSGVNANLYGYNPGVVPASLATASQSGSYDGQVNGVAIGSDGGLYVSTLKKVVKVDPTTAEIVGDTVFTTPYTGTAGQFSDLTSCGVNDPTTLTVQKRLILPDGSELGEGTGITDEFELSVSTVAADNTTELLATETAKTSVEGTNILAEKIGPTWVEADGTLEIKEESNNRPTLYDSTLECVISGEEGEDAIVPIEENTGKSGRLKIPDNAAGRNVTCTFTNIRKDEPAVCTPDELLVATYEGYVVSGSTDWAANTNDRGEYYDSPAWHNLYEAWNQGPGSSKGQFHKTGVNGIAMANDGTLYAYGRYNHQEQKNGKWTVYDSHIRLLTKGPNIGDEWEWLSSDTYPWAGEVVDPSSSDLGHYGYPVAGGIDPLAGTFVWGGPRNDDPGYFVLKEINVATGVDSYIGRIEVPLGATNGDLAFDPSGNLYVVVHDANNKKMSIVTVPHVEVEKGRADNAHIVPNTSNGNEPTVLSGSTATASSESAWVGGSQINGIAIGADGGLYISAGQWVVEVDPTTAQGIPNTGFENVSGNIGFTDLTSCGLKSPTTLTVQKQVVGEHGDHEFDLKVETADGTTSAVVAETTAKTGQGLLDEKVGPTWVTPNSSFKISESSDDLNSYASSFECHVDGVSDVEVPISGNNGIDAVVSIPPEASAKNVTCTFTNRTRPGSAEWEKVDTAETPLGGSVWELTGPLGDGGDEATVEITDCVVEAEGAEAPDCGVLPGEIGDMDPAVGKFKVEGLPLGAYTLTELKAPAGYVRVSTPHEFIVGLAEDEGDELVYHYDLGQIVNKKNVGPSLPLTGGISIVWYVVIGGTLFAAAATSEYVRRRKSA